MTGIGCYNWYQSTILGYFLCGWWPPHAKPMENRIKALEQREQRLEELHIH